jgi:hypothetical protein
MSYPFAPYDIAGVKVTVLEGEEHTRISQVTEQVVETGRVFADHIIQKPRTVTIRVEQPNVSFTGNNDLQEAIDVLDKLEAIWSDRGVIDLYTRHRVMRNMTITNLVASHNAPFNGRLKFVITLTQINEVNTTYSDIPTKQMENPSQAKTVQAGMIGAPALGVFSVETPFTMQLAAQL